MAKQAPFLYPISLKVTQGKENERRNTEREREDEIGGVKKKAMFAIVVFTLATLEIVLKEKTARREMSILVVTYNWVGVRSYLASKPPPKQLWVGCFCGHFSDQERLLRLDFHD